MKPRALAVLVLVSLAVPVSSAEEGFFDSGGVRLRYLVEGEDEGEPLVLLHGYGSSADVWRLGGLLARLSGERRVVALDLRGHGGSDAPHGADAYGARMAEDVVRLLDHLEIEEAHVAGYSMGGLVVLRLVTDHPERVRAAVVGGFGLPDPEPFQEMCERTARSLEEGGDLEALFAYLTPQGEELDPEVVRASTAVFLARNEVEAMAAVVRALPALVPDPARLRDSPVPAIAIAGERDGALADVDRLREAYPALVEVVVVEGASHATAFGSLFLESMLAFLEAHPMGAAAEAR